MKNLNFNNKSLMLLLFVSVYGYVKAIPAEIWFTRHNEKTLAASMKPSDLNANGRGYQRGFAMTAHWVDIQLNQGLAASPEAAIANFTRNGHENVALAEAGSHILDENLKPKIAAGNEIVLKARYGTPAAIYARNDLMGANGIAKSSRRPILIVQPTANALDMQIKSNFGSDAFDLVYTNEDLFNPNSWFDKVGYGALVKEVMNSPEYDGKLVLISWEHNAIPALVQAFMTYCGGAKLPSFVTAGYLPAYVANPKAFSTINNNKDTVTNLATKKTVKQSKVTGKATGYIFNKYDMYIKLTLAGTTEKPLVTKFDLIPQSLLRCDDGPETAKTFDYSDITAPKEVPYAAADVEQTDCCPTSIRPLQYSGICASGVANMHY